MRRRRVPTEKQLRDQSKAQLSLGNDRADDAGKIRTAKIESAPRKLVRVTGNVAVPTVDGGPIVGIGNDHDIGLVISRAGNHPRLELASVIGGAQVRVANTASNLQTTEFVFQKDVDHTGHRIAAVNSRGAILQDVDVIDHGEGNEIDVHPGGAGPAGHRSPPTTNYGSALSIDENQSFFGQQTAQVGDDAAVTAIGDVLINGPAHLLRQLGEQIGCVAHT